MTLQTLLDELESNKSPWSDVTTIVMSPKRMDQIRRIVPKAPPLVHPLAIPFGIEMEEQRLCDDSYAVLLGGYPAKRVLGMFSFLTGQVLWFNQNLMKRWQEPNFDFRKLGAVHSDQQYEGERPTCDPTTDSPSRGEGE